MRDVWVVGDGVCAQWQALERGVEVRYAVLGEEADEVEATDGVFALGGGEDGAESRSGVLDVVKGCVRDGIRTQSRCRRSAVARSNDRRMGRPSS